MKNNKVVLAYSGGLDTSYCLVYLSRVKDLEVYAVNVNTGGTTLDELEQMEQRAMALGARSFVSIDETKNFYSSCIRFLVYGNVLKNGTYPLSVSAERVRQAIAVAEYTKQVGASFVAHGSTGAGNDQVRFDIIFQTMIPEVEIMTPVRDMKLSRAEEIEFLRKEGLQISFEKAQYSINKGLWGTSVGGKETLSSLGALPEEAYPSQLTRNDSLPLNISFNKGELSAVNGKEFNSPVEAIQYLQELAAPFAIGRDIHVGDTIIGIKGRVGFEAAASMLIIKSHHLLEKHVLSKWQLFLKDQLSSWYGNWLHEGLFLDPVMRNIESFLEDSQQNVSGTVYLTLHPYRFTFEGIESPHDLMSPHFGSYGEMNRGWTGEDVRGFTKVAGNGMSIWHQVNQTEPESV